MTESMNLPPLAEGGAGASTSQFVFVSLSPGAEDVGHGVGQNSPAEKPQDYQDSFATTPKYNLHMDQAVYNVENSGLLQYPVLHDRQTGGLLALESHSRATQTEVFTFHLDDLSLIRLASYVVVLRMYCTASLEKWNRTS